MSTIGILSQIPNITKMPMHQVAILDSVLDGKFYGTFQDIVLPVAKDDLVRIQIKFKVDWDTGKTAYDSINKFIESVLGRPILMYEPIRHVPKSISREIGIMFYYIGIIDNHKCLIPVESWVLCPEHKQVVEDFTRYCFKDLK
jgi:hypothetical protein